MNDIELKQYCLEIASKSLAGKIQSAANLIHAASEIEHYLLASEITEAPVVKETEFTRDMALELMTCTNDPMHFFSNYCYLNYPVTGRVRFNPPSYQKDWLNLMRTEQRSIIRSDRQTGVDTTAAMHILHNAMYTPNQTILVIASKFNNAMQFMERVRLIFEDISPTFVRNTVTESSRASIEFANNSRILARCCGSDSARGLTANTIVMLDFEWIAWTSARDFLNSTIPALASTNGKIIITSTSEHEEPAHGSLIEELMASHNWLVAPYVKRGGADSQS